MTQPTFAEWRTGYEHRFADWRARLSQRYLATRFGRTRVGVWCYRSWLLLWWGFAAVVGVFIMHHFRNRLGPNFDIFVLSYISTVYAATMVIMLQGTLWWVARGVGLLFTVAADVIFYGYSALSLVFHLPRITTTPAADLVRTLFIIGGTLLAYGVLQWARLLNKPALPDLGALESSKGAKSND